MRPSRRLRKYASSCSVAQLGAREMLLRSLSPKYADGTLALPGNAQNKPCKCAKAQSAGTTGQKGQRDGRVMGHMRHIGHMRQKRPHKAGKCPHKAHLLRKKRGQSVSDGMSRASFGVFAVNLPGSAAAEPPIFLRSISKTIGVKRPALSRGRGGGVSPHKRNYFAEARSVCLGRNEPRFLWRLRGKPSWQACEAIKKPPMGIGGFVFPCRKGTINSSLLRGRSRPWGACRRGRVPGPFR